MGCRDGGGDEEGVGVAKACLRGGASIFFLMKLSVTRLVDRRPGYHAHLPTLKTTSSLELNELK